MSKSMKAAVAVVFGPRVPEPPPVPCAQRQRERAPHPQVIITLTPDHSALQAELPGASGARRVLSLRQNDESIRATLMRVLRAQLQSAVELGLDGSPTDAQVNHWERHHTWPDDRCRFCRAEGRTLAAPRKRVRADLHLVGDGSVQVRRVPKQARQLANAIRATAEDLGL